MPKKQAQRRIDRQGGTASRTINITGGSTSSGSGVEQHALAGTKHTGSLAERQAPWAVTDTEFSAHTGNTNAHHNRQHSLTSTSDHTLTASAYSILGATATNTIGLLHIASTGDGIDVSTGGGNFTIAVDVTDIIGAGLTEDGSNNLKVRVGDGLELDGLFVAVDETFDFDWTGDHTFASTLGSPSFASGFAGNGWRIDTSAVSMELNDLTVRGRLSVYELLIRQIRATNGNVFVSDSAKIATVAGSSPYTLTIDGTDGTDYQPFAVGDLIRAQRFTQATGTYQSNMQVTAVSVGGDTRAFSATLTSGDAPTVGMEFVRLGNMTDADRQGTIYLASSDTYAPFIDIVDGVDSFGDWNAPGSIKVRLGNLAGITDAEMGVLSGYGLYTQNAYLNGELVAANGDVAINTYGVQLESGNATGTFTDTSQNVTWTIDPQAAPAWDNISGQIWSDRYSSGGLVRNTMDMIAYAGDNGAGANTQADVANVRAGTIWLDPSTAAQSTLSFDITSGTATSTWYVTDNDGTGGVLLVGGGDGTNPVVLRPTTDNALIIGSGSYRIKELYVTTLYAGTTSSVDTGHNHNDIYYTEAEIDSLLSGYSTTGHTHAGYITSVELTAELASYVTSSSLTTTLADYYTEAEADALLADKSDVGHTHDTRYYTESEIDATLGNYVTSSGLTTTLGDYYTSAEVDTLLGSYSPSSHDIISTHTVTAAQYSVIGTPNGVDTLDVWATATDGSAGNKLLRTDSNGDLTIADLTADSVYNAGTLTLAGQNIVIEDEAGNEYWNIASDGTITSLDPAYTSTTGVTLTPGGYLEVQDGKYRGSIATAVFEYQQQSAVSGQMTIAKGAGKLYSDLAIDTINNDQASYSVEVFLTDPQVGHVPIAAIGDILIIRAAMIRQAQDAGNSWLSEMLYPMLPWAVDPNAANDIGEIELEVTDISDYSTYYGYTCDWVQKPGAARQGTFPAGTAVVNLGQADTNGGISLVADNPLATYMDVWINKDPSYAAGIYDRRRPILRLGQIDTLTGNADEVGIMASADLTSTQSSYFILSDQQQRLQNVPIYINDGTSDTVVISSDGMAIETYVLDFNDFISPYYLVKAIDNNLYGENEITWTSDTSAPTVDNTYGRLFNVQFDLFEPYYDDDDEYIDSGNEWWNYTVLEARHPAITGATGNILRMRALADDDTGSLESWRWAGIEVRSDSDFSRITIDATGNHTVADGILELIGDITLSAGAQAGQEFVRILTPQLPESTDGVTIDGTQRRLRFGQWYVNPSTDAISFARG